MIFRALVRDYPGLKRSERDSAGFSGILAEAEKVGLKKCVSIHPSQMTTPTNETKPEFIRPGDARKLFGISRPMVYQWIKAGYIESKVLRQRGKLTGIRLIPYDSIKKYIEKQTEESQAEESTTSTPTNKRK